MMYPPYDGDIDDLHKYVRAGGDINQISPNGWTLLIWASSFGNLQLVDQILEYGADPDLAGEDPVIYSGCNAIDVASSHNHLEVVKKLIAVGAKVFRVNPVNGWTPLMYATRNGHTEVMYELVKHMTNTQILHTAGPPTNKRSALIFAKGKTKVAIQNVLKKRRQADLRHIKNVVFKVFETMDETALAVSDPPHRTLISATHGPALTISEFCGVPRGLCHNKTSCGPTCRHFYECTTCDFLTKSPRALDTHRTTCLN